MASKQEEAVIARPRDTRGDSAWLDFAVSITYNVLSRYGSHYLLSRGEAICLSALPASARWSLVLLCSASVPDSGGGTHLSPAAMFSARSLSPLRLEGALDTWWPRTYTHCLRTRRTSRALSCAVCATCSVRRIHASLWPPISRATTSWLSNVQVPLMTVRAYVMY